MEDYVFRKEVFAALRLRNKMYGDVCLKEIIWRGMSSEKNEWRLMISEKKFGGLYFEIKMYSEKMYGVLCLQKKVWRLMFSESVYA